MIRKYITRQFEALQRALLQSVYHAVRDEVLHYRFMEKDAPRDVRIMLFAKADGELYLSGHLLKMSRGESLTHQLYPQANIEAGAQVIVWGADITLASLGNNSCDLLISDGLPMVFIPMKSEWGQAITLTLTCR